MSLAAKKSETKMPMPIEHAVLEERVDHIQGEVAELKQAVQRVDAKVDNVHADLNRLRNESGDFKAKVANDFGDLKTQMATQFGEVKAEMASQFGELKAQMKALEVSMIRWMIGTMVSATTLAVTIAKLLH
jgi:archaellum component FlaC